MGVETKTAVSVAEMARMVGLSRARFYSLLGSAFPYPVYDVSSKRPFYDELMQEACLEVRRRNCGIDGKPILFYCRRSPVATLKKKSLPAKVSGHADLLDGLRALGLNATVTQVDAAFDALFPNGSQGISHGEVVRRVFIHLKKNGAT